MGTKYSSHPYPSLNQSKGNQSNSKYHPTQTDTQTHIHTHTTFKQCDIFYYRASIWSLPTQLLPAHIPVGQTPPISPIKQLSRQPHQHLGIVAGRPQRWLPINCIFFLFTTLGNHLLLNLALLGLTHNHRMRQIDPEGL